MTIPHLEKPYNSFPLKAPSRIKTKKERTKGVQLPQAFFALKISSSSLNPAGAGIFVLCRSIFSTRLFFSFDTKIFFIVDASDVHF